MSGSLKETCSASEYSGIKAGNKMPMAKPAVDKVDRRSKNVRRSIRPCAYSSYQSNASCGICGFWFSELLFCGFSFSELGVCNDIVRLPLVAVSGDLRARINSFIERY